MLRKSTLLIGLASLLILWLWATSAFAQIGSADEPQIVKSNGIITRTFGTRADDTIDVFLMASPADYGAPAMAAELSGYPDIGVVTLFDTAVGTPTVGEMAAHDVVWMTTDQSMADPDATCDNVATYLDGGGKVALSTFCWADQGGNTIRGRLLTEYSPFQIAGSSLYEWADLGPHEPHPIFKDVTTLHCYFRDNVSLSPSATLLGSWTDGVPMAAEKGNVIAISAALHQSYPDHSSGWTGDGWTLVYNTVVYLGKMNTGTIDGKVKDEVTGGPIPKAFVLTVKLPTKEKAFDLTDADGYYEIPDLVPAYYFVICFKKGYNFAWDIVKVESGKTTTVDFMLSPAIE